MKQIILKRIGGVIALVVLLLFGVAVFGQENSASSEFTSPEFAPDLFIVPLLDPDVAVVNPPQSTDVTTQDISSGELQRIEDSVDVWTKELEELDIKIMKIQRGGPSANIVDDRDESDEKKGKETKDENKLIKEGKEVEKNNQGTNLKVLKEDRKSLIKDIKKASEKVESKSKKRKEIEDILENVKSVNFDPNDIIGELEKLDIKVEVEIEKQLRKIERVQKRALVAREAKTKESPEKSRSAKEVEKDTDGDGISDYDEVNIYETDPASSDSDNDGYSDGLEILIGFSPLDSSPTAVISYENPKNTLVEETEIFSVSKIEVIKTGNTSTDEPDQILIEGKALPNSFVTLYIFSIPTIVTIKTDSEGSWTYILDKEIENGEHELYVATTDNTGKILAKSSPIPFTKEVAAVTVDIDLLAFGTQTGQQGFFSGMRTYVLIAFFIAVIIGFFMFIGRKKKKDEFFIE